MKKTILVPLILLLTLLNAKAQQKIHFDYDAAGNQVARLWCSGCDAKNASIKKIADLEASDLKKFLPEDTFSYYPNPVKEELFLKWEITKDYAIATIQVFNSTGILLKTINNLNTVDNYSIMFQDYATGIYFLELISVNGEQKTD